MTSGSICDLTRKKCVPCSGEIKPFDNITAKNYLKKLYNWRFGSNRKWLIKEFKFRNFLETLEFVNKVSAIAEQEQHHPNINFTWGYCKISIQTHKINGLCENDFILASKIDEIHQ
jgi:4a-hydroxytetrahydrobiopterin dehydratase